MIGNMPSHKTEKCSRVEEALQKGTQPFIHDDEGKENTETLLAPWKFSKVGISRAIIQLHLTPSHSRGE